MQDEHVPATTCTIIAKNGYVFFLVVKKIRCYTPHVVRSNLFSIVC